MINQPSKPFNTSIFLFAVLSAATPMASLPTHKSSLKPSRSSNPSSPPPLPLTTTTHNASTPPPPPLRSSSSSQPSHFAMIELKQRILASISKLSDRYTHHIAVEDLEKIIQTLSPDSIPLILNCLYDATGDPKPSSMLIGFLCTSQTDCRSTHLNKIISTIVKRLNDKDLGIRDVCRDTTGVLSFQYLKGGDGE